MVVTDVSGGPILLFWFYFVLYGDFSFGCDYSVVESDFNMMLV